MRFQKTGQGAPSGLDKGKPDGTKRSKKRTSCPEEEEKHDRAVSVAPETAGDAVDVAKMPKIQPGEHFSAFAARVDATLPVAGLKKKGKKAFDHSTGVGGAKLTRMERKMHKMQTEWREEEARRKAKQEDEADEREDDDEWVERLEMAKALQETGSQKKKKRRRTAEDEDPWAAVKKARGDEGRQKSVMDVVQAPPKLGSVKEIFKVKGRDMGRRGVEVANVPAKSGSLRRREELGQARQDFVQQYRRSRARGVRLRDAKYPI
jgi:hypothetical protein